MQYWTLSGNPENWETALEGNIWGLREGRLKSLWENISNGDILFFYCLSPIGGIIGFGKCLAKFKEVCRHLYLRFRSEVMLLKH